MILSILITSAQDRKLNFYYITKDYTTSTNNLCDWLEAKYKDGEENPLCCNIFYLANEESAIVIRQNLSKDNSHAFQKELIANLVRRSETAIVGVYDINNIIKILNEINILDATGSKTFSVCNINFIVTPTFWNLSYNETLIAKLYTIMEVGAEWAKGYVNFNIYHSDKEGIMVDQDHPLGRLYNCIGYDFQMLKI